MTNGRTEISGKNLIRWTIAATLFVYGAVVAAEEPPYARSNAESDSYQEPAEEPITSGTPFSWEDADKVQNGMTEAEVIAILGQPYMRNQTGDEAILVWSYTSGAGSNAIACRFTKGRVVGSHRISR